MERGTIGLFLAKQREEKRKREAGGTPETDASGEKENKGKPVKGPHDETQDSLSPEISLSSTWGRTKISPGAEKGKR